MNVNYYFVMLTLLPMSMCLAQASITEKPNRRQELYDRYHGITKKPKSTTASPNPATTVPTADRTGREPSSSDGRESRMTDGPPASQQQSATVDVNSRGLRIGFRGGVTYPVFTDNRPYSTPEAGFVGGLTLNVGRGVVSFQPELNYTRYSVRDNFDPGFGTTRFANDYVEVPLFLKIATGTYAGNRFFLNIGPYASYATSTSIDGKKMDISRAKGRFGFGAAAGIGTALKAGPGHITLEVRSLYALGDTDNGFGTTNTLLGQATLGYIFLLGGRQ